MSLQPIVNTGWLYQYLQDTQRLLGDPKEEKWSRFDLQRFINAGRRKVAAEAQCCRFLMPSSGSFATVYMIDPGSGYSDDPTVTVTMPDAWGVGFTTAVIGFDVVGGQITNPTIVVSGSGYINPTISIQDPTGSGAVFGWTLTPFVATIAAQEVYNFQDYNFLLPAGLAEIYAIQNVTCNWGGIKPTMRHLDWSGFQAYLRSYNTQSTNWPAVWAQYGNGNLGSIYLNPIPSMPLQMEWDCYCLPDDLTDNSDQEMLPYPFTEAVPYYAAWWAFIPVDSDKATYYDQLYKRAIKEARSWADVPVFPDFYTPDIA